VKEGGEGKELYWCDIFLLIEIIVFKAFIPYRLLHLRSLLLQQLRLGIAGIQTQGRSCWIQLQ